ncbi:serpin family protein [Henriciella sp. AS95]|uniref:serpin family protein n=1 Tax=Henriciella sp. AS95 TaxID=3135782 RepID=UPI003179C57C
MTTPSLRNIISSVRQNADAPAKPPESFAAALYNTVRDRPGNLFISPVSLEACLALLLPGARGETLAGLQETLGHGGDADATIEASSFLQRRLATGDTLSERDEAMGREPEPQPIYINNSVWFDPCVVVEQAWLDAVAQYFDAEEHRAPFREDRGEAASTINRWVEDKTNNRIKNLLDAGSMSPDIRAVLVNTIYMKAGWATEFSHRDTTDHDFELASGQTVQVPMMGQTRRYQFHRGKSFSVARLAYRPAGLCMDVILPLKGVSVSEVERLLVSGDTLTEELDLSNADFEKLDLKLPKFRVEKTYELSPALNAMGLRKCFGLDADFSGIADPARQPDGKGIAFDEVIQKTFVEVDEEGTEAAAATAIEMVDMMIAPSGYEPPPTPFHCDRPFLFVIREQETGAIPFMGRIEDPRAG